MTISLTRPRLRALFDAIGGETGLGQTLDLFYERMAADAMLGFFFLGHDLKAIALKQKSFLMKAMGVTLHYDGRPPGRAHSALPPIQRGMFDRRLVILREVLVSRGLTDEDIATWIDFESSFRPVIVRPEGS